MSDRSDEDFLRDILEAIRRVGDYTAGVTYEGVSFGYEDPGCRCSKSGNPRRGREKSLGGSSSSLSGDFLERLAAIRDKLIHHYFGVNFDVVWQVATVELPSAANALSVILENISS